MELLTLYWPLNVRIRSGSYCQVLIVRFLLHSVGILDELEAVIWEDEGELFDERRRKIDGN